MEEEGQINHGFDRGIDYESMKEKIINASNKYLKLYNEHQNKTDFGRLVFVVIAGIQLRNGSRISEAVKAFILFVNKGISNRVTVKISKSDGFRVMKDGTRKQKIIRFREMMWPADWFDSSIYKLIKDNELTYEFIESGTLKKRVLDFLRRHMDSNTHSLRYAFINYMLYVVKRPPEDIAKFVGHIDTKMLTRYTQTKNCHQIFDLDI